MKNVTLSPVVKLQARGVQIVERMHKDIIFLRKIYFYYYVIRCVYRLISYLMPRDDIRRIYYTRWIVLTLVCVCVRLVIGW